MNTLTRRQALARGGAVAGAAALSSLAGCRPNAPARTDAGDGDVEVLTEFSSWQQVRGQFQIGPGTRHFAAFVMAPHPAGVRAAIETHRRGLDEDPFGYVNANEYALEDEARSAAAAYLGADAGEIALTDSTTMGLGLVYRGVKLREGQEILTTEHDFYSTHEALRLRAEATGASVRKVSLFSDVGSASESEIVDSVASSITDRTRIVAITWVHSGTGLKLPVRAIADEVARRNSGRRDEDRLLLCVDGIHGLGVEDTTVEELGCDFLIAGTHKWLFGPRGTGIVWGRDDAWDQVVPTIPTFALDSIIAWIQNQTPSGVPLGPLNSPGGFHSFEHRWALVDAFRFHEAIGKARIAERTHGLARRLKEGLTEIGTINLVTPMDEALSGGIVCFEVAGRDPGEVVDALRGEQIIASVTPYADRYVRFGTSIVTDEDDVDAALEALATLA